MTAEIAILNRKGVAIAADSAVTFSRGSGEKKIYNTANKVFMLSKYEPVGIMIYGSTRIMGIEWELLIKDFRRELHDTPFPTLQEYVDAFEDYLKKTPVFTKELIEKYVVWWTRGYLQEIQSETIKRWEASENGGSISKDKAVEIMVKTFSDIIGSINENDLPNYSFSDFKDEYYSQIAQEIDNQFSQQSNATKNRLIDAVYRAIVSVRSNDHCFGIVIAGYGRDEFFPSLARVVYKGRIGRVLIESDRRKESITLDSTAIIMPFAQSEMVVSFMDGITPEMKGFLDDQMKTIFGHVEDMSPSLKGLMDEIKERFDAELWKFKQIFYTKPILDIVDSLPKIELAEMAESLVNLTAFKRHVSTDAETVARPIDVAIISKDDGFIWVKRKHYFEPSLNQHFLANYYRGN